MCLEDNKIGIKTRSASLPFVGTGATQEVLATCPTRRSIILGAPSAGTISYLNGVAPVAGAGFNLAAGQTPIELDRNIWGDMVVDVWYAVTAAAGQNFAVGYALQPELPL